MMKIVDGQVKQAKDFAKELSLLNGSNQRWQETSNSAPVAFVLPLHLNG
jgi:hypothetical protein